MSTYGDDIQAAIVAQIRAEMAVKGWGQKDLSIESGIATSTLGRYLAKNEARDIPLPVFAEIARALGLPMIELAARAQRRLDGENVL